MHALMVAATIVWFLLVALLWAVRPGDVVWLFGTLILGGLYLGLFGWYVTRQR